MLFEELSKDLKEAVVEIKHYSNAINCDLDDALEKADNHEEFRELFRSKMIDLIAEARDAVNRICGD